MSIVLRPTCFTSALAAARTSRPSAGTSSPASSPTPSSGASGPAAAMRAFAERNGSSPVHHRGFARTRALRGSRSRPRACDAWRHRQRLEGAPRPLRRQLRHGRLRSRRVTCATKPRRHVAAFDCDGAALAARQRTNRANAAYGSSAADNARPRAPRAAVDPLAVTSALGAHNAANKSCLRISLPSQLHAYIIDIV